MRLSPVATACLLLSLALILPGCGDERTAAADGAAAREAGEPSEPRAANATSADGCRSELHPLVNSMDALREQLAVGLNYEDYLDAVRRLKAVYDGIPVRRLAIGCLTAVGGPSERALNRYRSAANTWGDCLAEVSCDAEEIEPQLQRRWALASSLLTTAQEGLR